MKSLVIIPAYNEAENIAQTVQRLQEKCPGQDYIIVNDGSRDKTARICRKNGFPLLDLATNLGLSGAFQTGLCYAEEQGYDCVIQFDGDGQHRPEYIRTMEEQIEKGYDIVIASRFAEKKKPFSLRMLGSRLIEWSLIITVGRRIKDPTSGMRAYNRSMIKKLAHGSNCSPEPDTIAWLIRGGAKVKEIQTEMDERTAGESYLNWSSAFRYMVRMGMSILVFQWVRPRNKPKKQKREKI